MNYEELLDLAYDAGIKVADIPLYGSDGKCYGNVIGLRNTIDTSAKRGDILAEELGHYYTTVGDISDQTKTENRKQERKARAWGYGVRFGLDGIIAAYQNHCTTLYKIAEYLDVTEECLAEGIEYYRQKYGDQRVFIGDYILCFEPMLTVERVVRF